jgi:opacity protein-like surface antigen
MHQRESLLAGIAVFALTMTAPATFAAGPDCFCKNTLVTSSSVTATVPPALWQGFYIGGNLGGDWSDIGGSRSYDLNFPTVTGPLQTGDISGSGVIGGAQFGYNWQFPQCCFVAGIEADLGGIDAGLRHNTVSVQGTGADYASFRAGGDGGFYGDITGRIGYNWVNTLFYAKGGFAWFDPNLSAQETVVTNGVTSYYGNSNGNGSSFLTGWTIGAGFESMINPRWSWKVEYMFFDFSTNDNGCCFDGNRNFRYFNNDLTINSVKVGFNYILNGTLPSLK